MELMVIKVCGIPDVDIGEQMLDQLRIHFQRRSNSGSDVLTVLPAPSSDQAYVVFEKEVPGVLQFNHVLEVDCRFYPIHVQKAHQSEVDMAVETKLSLRMFSKPQDVWLLLESNGFKITQISPNLLHLKGSFLSLILSRKQLAQLQAQEVPPQGTSSSSLFNGYNSPASLSLTQSLSEYGNPDSVGSPRHLLSNSGCSSHSRPPSSKRKEASLLVKKDVLDYAFKYEEDVIKKIGRVCEMSIKDDGEVTTVIFWGGNCEKAKLKLQACVEKIGPHLHTQEIDLNKYNLDKCMKIRQRIQIHADNMSGVLIKQDGETVKLVGSSKTIFEMKQKLLGHNAGPSTPSERGRTLERNSVQRSSSLPRQYMHKSGATDQEHNADPKYRGGHSDYHEEPQSRRAQGQADEPQSRRRSNSESRDKNKANRVNPKQLEEMPSSPSDEKKKHTDKYFPVIKKTLVNLKISTPRKNKK